MSIALLREEAMSRMTEAQLSKIDNLEIGRYGYGAVKWPGWGWQRSGIPHTSLMTGQKGCKDKYGISRIEHVVN